MFAYLLQRLTLFLATLAIASVVVFGVLEVLPGNAAETMLGSTATPEAVAALSHKLGLDQPLATRYAAWVTGALSGDLGQSYAYNSPIAPLIVEQIFSIVRDLNRETGLTVFLVEQNAWHALRLASRAYVLVNGTVTLSGTGRELLARPEVRAAYLEGGH